MSGHNLRPGSAPVCILTLTLTLTLTCAAPGFGLFSMTLCLIPLL